MNAKDLSRPSVYLLAACGFATVAAAAQAPVPACDPTAPPAEVRQAPYILYGEVLVARGAAQPIRTYAALLLRALAYRLRLPSPLTLTVWGNPSTPMGDSLQPGGAVWIHPDLPLGAYLVINRAGTLRRLVLAQTTQVPEIDSALVAPLEASVDTTLLPVQLLAGSRDSIVLYFATSIRSDSSRGLAGLDSGAVIQPLSRVLLPHVRLQKGPRPLREGDRLSYPRRAGRSIQADGQVHMQFTIGADGRVAPGSLRMRDGSSPEFVEEVYEALAGMQFEPATSGDCAIAMVVEQAFTSRHGFIIR